MEKEVIDRLRGYIAKCEWKWARTMPDCPHEYIYRGKCALSDKEYMDFLYQQVHYGEPSFFGKKKIPYLYIDGYKYWTMGDYDVENKTMNRQKLFDCYDKIADIYDELRNSEECKRQNIQVSTMISDYRIGKSIYEIGCGTGLLFDYIKIDKDLYQGIEPSRKMLDIFRFKHREFGRRVRRKAFEEDGMSFANYDSVIALFGTPSYIMKQYLQRLANNAKGIFLMFFKENYKPEFCNKEGVCITHFEYSTKELFSMFKTCKIIQYDNYRIVTNFDIDYKKIANIKNEKKEESSKQMTLF